MTGPDASRWLRRFHPAPAGAPRLVCFPYAGGSASYYFPVSTALSPGVEVVVVQYPGRQERRTEPVLTDIAGLADQVTAALADQPPAPTVLFGHSMGALVGYEVARRLEARGILPTHLYVSGRRAPGEPRPEETVHLRDDAGVLAELTALGGPGSELLADEELAGLVLPPIRADYTAVETYRWAPGPPLHCPITALAGDADPRVDVEDVRGWAAQTTGPFELRVFAGDHFFVGTRAAEVLATLRESLPVSPV